MMTDKQPTITKIDLDLFRSHNHMGASKMIIFNKSVAAALASIARSMPLSGDPEPVALHLGMEVMVHEQPFPRTITAVFHDGWVVLDGGTGKRIRAGAILTEGAGTGSCRPPTRDHEPEAKRQACAPRIDPRVLLVYPGRPYHPTCNPIAGVTEGCVPVPQSELPAPDTTEHERIEQLKAACRDARSLLYRMRATGDDVALKKQTIDRIDRLV